MARYQIETRQSGCGTWMGNGTENAKIVYSKSLRGTGFSKKADALAQAEAEAQRMGLMKRAIDTKTGEILGTFGDVEAFEAARSRRMAEMQTVIVSPIDLVVGDRVMYHGATVEVMRINESECLVEGGIRVAACISRRVGDECGSIPPGWFETAESMRDRGCPWIKDLPEGRYITVQGNAHARVAKIVG